MIAQERAIPAPDPRKSSSAGTFPTGRAEGRRQHDRMVNIERSPCAIAARHAPEASLAYPGWAIEADPGPPYPRRSEALHRAGPAHAADFAKATEGVPFRAGADSP